MRPKGVPIGLQLARTSKVVSRAFNDALTAAGGSLPVWLILSALRGGPPASQQRLAATVGIEGPTLTRHLDGLEAAGLVRRIPHPDDRRAFQVEPTAAGRTVCREQREVHPGDMRKRSSAARSAAGIGTGTWVERSQHTCTK